MVCVCRLDDSSRLESACSANLNKARRGEWGVVEVYLNKARRRRMVCVRRLDDSSRHAALGLGFMLGEPLYMYYFILNLGSTQAGNDEK